MDLASMKLAVSNHEKFPLERMASTVRRQPFIGNPQPPQFCDSLRGADRGHGGQRAADPEQGPHGGRCRYESAELCMTKTPAADEVIGEPLIRVPVLPARETTVIIRSLAAAAPTYPVARSVACWDAARPGPGSCSSSDLDTRARSGHALITAAGSVTRRTTRGTTRLDRSSIPDRGDGARRGPRRPARQGWRPRLAGGRRPRGASRCREATR